MSELEVNMRVGYRQGCEFIMPVVCVAVRSSWDWDGDPMIGTTAPTGYVCDRCTCLSVLDS